MKSRVFSYLVCVYERERKNFILLMTSVLRTKNISVACSLMRACHSPAMAAHLSWYPRSIWSLSEGEEASA